MTLLLKATNLEKSFGLQKKEKLFENLSLDGRALEKIAIIGPSGSGKSTLLNILSTVDHPTKGSIELFGHTPAAFALPQIRRKIGIAFQSFYLLEEESILDNLLLPCKIAGISSEKAKKNALELLEKVGLGGMEQSKVSLLSGGEKRRVTLIRALVHKPKIIFADEPTSNLDLFHRRLIIDLLLEESAALGALLIFATHDLSLAEKADLQIGL